MYTCHVKDM